jgi:FkbM family methyltransferase
MEFSVELLARRIAQQLPSRPSLNGAPQTPGVKPEPIDLSPLWSIADDGSFLREAYQLILNRPADVAGFTHYRELLRSGVSRRVVAHSLACSEEARQSGRRYTGVPHIPVVAEKHWRAGEGKIRSAWKRGLSALHSVHRALLQAAVLERVDNKLNVVISELDRRLDLLSKKTDESLWTLSSKLDDYVSALNQDLKGLDARLAGESAEAARSIGRITAGLGLVTRRLDDLLGETGVSRDLASRFDRLSLEIGRGREDLQRSVEGAIRDLDRLVQVMAADSTRLGGSLREALAGLRELQAATARLSTRLDDMEGRWVTLEAMSRKLLEAQDEATRSVERGARETEQWMERITREQAASRAAAEERGIGLAEGLERVSSRLHGPAVQAAGVVAVEVGGFIVGFPAAEWRLAAYHVFRGPMEPGLLRRFTKLIRPGMTVIDVGANVGLFSLHAARQLSGCGCVVAFEPAPDTFRLLKDNIQVNGFLETGLVRLLRQAVLDRAGAARLAVYPDDCGLNTLFPAAEPPQTVEVEAVSLDSALSGSRRVDVVKIDAEGAEPRIIRGMAGLLAGNPELRILLEFAPSLLSRAGVSPADFLTELQALGLNLAVIHDVTGDLRPVDRTALLSAFHANLFASRAPVSAEHAA